MLIQYQNKDQPMTAYHEDLSWLTNKNRSIYQKTFKQKGNQMFQM